MARKKNILMILVDQERMPMHFPDNIALPARTWLRERGVSFNRYHVNTAPCTPSRSVIFTGWHTPRNRMLDNTTFDYVGDMDPEIATLGDMAAAGGYYSVYKGKWHLADLVATESPRYTTEDAMRAYGFRDFQHDGDLMSTAREGYTHDGRIAAESIFWLNQWLNYPRDEPSDMPFFFGLLVRQPPRRHDRRHRWQRRRPDPARGRAHGDHEPSRARPVSRRPQPDLVRELAARL
ncbi:MAG: hypothetical protein Tsb0020_21460 [Haliangiales bacterium]